MSGPERVCANLVPIVFGGDIEGPSGSWQTRVCLDRADLRVSLPGPLAFGRELVGALAER